MEEPKRHVPACGPQQPPSPPPSYQQQQQYPSVPDIATMSDTQFQDSLDALLDVPLPRVDPAQVAEVDATLLGGLPLGEEQDNRSNEPSHHQEPASNELDKMMTKGTVPNPVSSGASCFSSNSTNQRHQGVDLSSLVHQLGPSSTNSHPRHHMHTGNLYAGNGYSDCKKCSVDTASTTSSDATSYGGGTRKRSLKHRTQQQHHNNNKSFASAPAISEDEIEARKRRSDRNAREQARSQKIADQIAELHRLLEHADIQHKPDKYHTLLCTAHYIRKLQQQAADLQQQHDQLLKTIQQAAQHVNKQYVGVNASTASNSSTAASVASSSGTGITPPTVVSSASMSSLSGCESASNNMDCVAAGTTTQEESILSCPEGINYKWIFDCSTFASAVTSMDGRFLECNHSFEQMSGYHRGELLDVPEGKTRNMSIFNILERQHIERIFAPLSEMLQYNEETRQQETSHRDSLSETVDLGRQEMVPYKTVELRVTLIRSPSGHPRFFNCVLIPTEDPAPRMTFGGSSSAVA